MRRMIQAATALSLAVIGSAAQAGVTISAVPGSPSYAGPFTYDFETAAPVTGGAIRTGSHSGLAAQPFGSTGNYWTMGPSDGSTGIMDLSGFAAISAISFLWGSVDDWNWLDVLDRNGGVLASFNGTDVAVAPNGDWFELAMNPYATIAITGADRANIGGLRFSSGTNAFEVDNFAIASVPEPATWLSLVLGFGLLGGTMRMRTRQAAASRLALRLAR